jgi:release factor glutamine methyltransferase
MRAEPAAMSMVVASLRAAGCVFAEDEAALLMGAASTQAELDGLVAERAGGRPLEYILGFTEFCGMRIGVTDGVFVPRQRTEFLVRCALGLLPTESNPSGQARVPPVVLDLCCGCGAIGAALAHRAPIELHACDLEPGAVRCARGNVEPVGGQVYEGDLYGALPDGLRGRVDIIVANAPYVPSDAIALMPPEARLYEPRIALDGGGDGLDVQRRVISGARPWLAGGGHLLIETGEEQAPLTADVMRSNGFSAQIKSSAELYGTVVIGRRPPR